MVIAGLTAERAVPTASWRQQFTVAWSGVEKIVPAGHTLFSNEATVLEIKRILERTRDRRFLNRVGVARSK